MSKRDQQSGELLVYSTLGIDDIESCDWDPQALPWELLRGFLARVPTGEVMLYKGVDSQGVAVVGGADLTGFPVPEIVFTSTRPDVRGLGYATGLVLTLELTLEELGYGIFQVAVTSEDVMTREVFSNLGYEFMRSERRDRWEVTHRGLIWVEATVDILVKVLEA